jgi:hypothetical protein
LIILYVLLLLAGIACFVMHFVAQYRFATILRQRYPEQWKIIAVPESGKANGFRTWTRLQHVLRSGAPALFNDKQLSFWHRAWRLAPLIAWPCWFAAIALQYFARHG